MDAYGWLGSETVGVDGSKALFLLIQHAELEDQIHYLPMFRSAVKKGKAEPTDLAFLEDRIALRKGGKQIYGSQVGRNIITGKFYVLPLVDPENVDKRREEVHLPPLRSYVSHWGIDWSIENYEKGLKENTN